MANIPGGREDSGRGCVDTGLAWGGGQQWVQESTSAFSPGWPSCFQTPTL